jgi:hypothetical protein
MSTLSQIEANRRNAKKSTGPRTLQGKAESRLNALQTGIYAQSMIIQGEDPAQLEALTEDYIRQYRPANATERGLMDILVDCEWKLRRFRTIEARIFDEKLDDLNPNYIEEEHRAAEAYSRADSTYVLLQRRIDSTHRILLRTITALTRAQATRPEMQSEELPSPFLVSPSATHTGAGPQADPPPNQLPFAGIGFVPSTRPTCGQRLPANRQCPRPSALEIAAPQTFRYTRTQ